MRIMQFKLGLVQMFLLLLAYFAQACCMDSRLKIIVPKGYVGEITLVLSIVQNDILTVDNSGIGYITKRTFDKTYRKPVVFETDGTNISNQIVGFSTSAFWGKGRLSVANEENNPQNKAVEFLSFEVVPKERQGEKQYYIRDIEALIDKEKVLYR